METVYSAIFFRRFIRIEPFNTGQATFGFICTVGGGPALGFVAAGEKGGEKKETVLTSNS